MSLLLIKLREISTFIYIFIFLLLFNLFFNLNFEWYGISLIVKTYLFVFSFYLIFNFASPELDDFKTQYMNKYGKKGKSLFFLQTKVFPFLLIYLSIILFSLIDYLRLPNWPWHIIFSLFKGKHSNLVIYSLFLLLILKLKKEPIITIPLFLAVCTLYFFIDKIIYTTPINGITISTIKITKLFIIFFLFFKESIYKIFRSFVYSLILSFFIFFSVVGFFSAVYGFFPENTFQKNKSGLILMRFGLSYPLPELQDLVLKNSDFHLFNKLQSAVKKYNMRIDYRNDEWITLLFSGSTKMADLISANILDKNITLSYEKIIKFAENKSQITYEHLEKASYFIKISSRYIKGNEVDFFPRVRNNNKTFKLWAMTVLAEQKGIKSIPLLLEFLTDIDMSLSQTAYMALMEITGLNPQKKLNIEINDPETIITFKEYFLRHHKKP